MNTRAFLFEISLVLLMQVAISLVLPSALVAAISWPLLLWCWFRACYPQPDFIVGDHYLHRYYIIPRNRFFNIYVHHIMKSDDDRALHDHPWWSVSFKLAGQLTEITERGARKPWRFMPVLRSPRMAHRLVIAPGQSAWTLFITGPRLREWGFYCPKGWRPWYEYCASDNAGQIGRGCD